MLLSLRLQWMDAKGPWGWTVCSLFPAPSILINFPEPGVWGLGSFIIVPIVYFFKPKYISLAQRGLPAAVTHLCLPWTPVSIWKTCWSLCFCGLPWWLREESAYDAGDPGSTLGSGKSREGTVTHSSNLALGNPTDRSLAGYKLWGYRVRRD